MCKLRINLRIKTSALQKCIDMFVSFTPQFTVKNIYIVYEHILMFDAQMENKQSIVSFLS